MAYGDVIRPFCRAGQGERLGERGERGNLTLTVAIGRKNSATVDTASILRLSCSMMRLSCCTTRLND
jgi:hypothetical protein